MVRFSDSGVHADPARLHKHIENRILTSLKDRGVSVSLEHEGLIREHLNSLPNRYAYQVSEAAANGGEEGPCACVRPSACAFASNLSIPC